MVECSYDAVGCAYLIGLQVALEAVEYVNHNSACIDLGHLRMGV